MAEKKANKPKCAGDRRYRVHWRDGSPRIEVGRLEQKGRGFRAVFPSDKSGQGHQTMLAAIREEILQCADYFGSRYHKARCKPWTLAASILKLMRLARTLEKHHLIELPM